jgi:GNAT superfamily N-acetyltransferase
MCDVERLVITRALESDAREIAEIYLASRSDALPYLPRLHTDTEVRAWIEDVALERGETWVARKDGSIVGFLTLMGDQVDQLYILPAHYRCGVGKQLLEVAKQRRPHRLYLYTFQRNARARAFYEAQGFRIVDANDGTRNEENEPDICYAWAPSGAFPASETPIVAKER